MFSFSVFSKQDLFDSAFGRRLIASDALNPSLPGKMVMTIPKVPESLKKLITSFGAWKPGLNLSFELSLYFHPLVLH